MFHRLACFGVVLLGVVLVVGWGCSQGPPPDPDAGLPELDDPSELEPVPPGKGSAGAMAKVFKRLSRDKSPSPEQPSSPNPVAKVLTEVFRDRPQRPDVPEAVPQN